MTGPRTAGLDQSPQQRDDKKKNETPSSEESEVSDVAEVAEDDDSQNLTPELPFSKARCIALVAVLAGASFLNVRRHCNISLPDLDLARRRYCDWAPNH